jgi:hypothetical protein
MLALLYRYVVAPRMGTIILSAIVAHTAWHWMADRFGILRQYEIRWPSLDASFLANILRGATLILILVLVGWGLYSVLGKLFRPAPEQEPNA